MTFETRAVDIGEAAVVLAEAAAGEHLAVVGGNFSTADVGADLTLSYFDSSTGETRVVARRTVSPGTDEPLGTKYALAPGDRIEAAASAGVVQGALTVGAILVANNPGFRPRGVWQAGVGYDPNDVVSRDGVAYAAINSATDEPPPSPNWMQFGAKGDPGDLTSTATAELQVGYTTQVHTLSSGPTVVPSFADGALQALVATTATSIDVPVLGSGVMEIEVDNTGGHGVATTGNFAAVTGVPPAAGIGRLTVTRFTARTYGDWQ